MGAVVWPYTQGALDVVRRKEAIHKRGFLLDILWILVGYIGSTKLSRRRRRQMLRAEAAGLFCERAHLVHPAELPIIPNLGATRPTVAQRTVDWRLIPNRPLLVSVLAVGKEYASFGLKRLFCYA